MRNDCDRAPVIAQEGLHPALGIDIEVVGGLVQQKDVGLLQEEGGHRNPHLPATGEFAAVTLEVVPVKAESTQDGLDAWLDAGGIKMLKLQFQFPDLLQEIGIGCGAGGKVLKRSGTLVNLTLEFPGFCEGGLRLLPEGVT